MSTSARRRHGTTGSRAAGAAIAAGLAATALVLTACGTPAAALDDDLDTVGASSTPFSYTGGVQQYTVPDGVTNLTVTASGGSGGASRTANNVEHAASAEVSGTLPVQPGQVLLISVGQAGADADSHDRDPAGGWGGLGATGGNGNAASDTLRTGAAGGGATTVQLAAADGSDPVTVLVAGGGGGQGGVSGDSDSIGDGGTAGCTGGDQTPSWQGGNGGNGSDVKGGKGGAAGGESGMAGGRGQGGSGLGGNGGGGGGGVAGGNPGSGASGTSAAGGGGAGSSAASGMDDAVVSCRVDRDGDGIHGNGQVVVTPVDS